MVKIGHYNVQYDIRIQKKDGHYARMLIQYSPVNYKGQHLYHNQHLHTDITHIKKQGHPCCSILGSAGEPSYYNIEELMLISSLDPLFTVREKEVVKGIMAGMTSQEIADQLCLSIHTINSHCKNILAKGVVRTPLQLIKKCIEEGWL